MAPFLPPASFVRRLLVSLCLAGTLLAQVRPPGGGGGGVPATPTIVAPPGALAGVRVDANVFLGQVAGGGGGGATPATYQWTVSGARILNDPRSAAIQFIADGTGTVSLSVTVTVAGTTYTPSAQVTVVAAETAGTIITTATVTADATSVSASVPPAQNGDRTFRWAVGGGATIVSGQGTPTITFRPGTPGLKQITCNVNLQNLVSVPVTAYVVATGTGAPVAVAVTGGSGSGTYPAGSRVDVFADPPAAGQVFDKWTGDVALLGANPLAATLSRIAIAVPTTPVTLTATYKAAPAWTTRSITTFNPQTQNGPNNTTTTVSTTLTSYIPANATGLVFLLHTAGSSHD